MLQQKSAALLESGALSFLASLTLTAANVHDIAIICSLVGTVLSGVGARFARLEKSGGRRRRKQKPTKSPDNGAI
jgi:uncharacterized MnhB-related membrane protein